MIRFISYMRPLIPDWERWLFYLMHRNQHRESRKGKKQRNIFQMKEHSITSGKDLNETEISDLPDKAFKIMVMNMLTEVRRTIIEQSGDFNKEIENIRKYQREIKELKSTIIKLKNSI